MGGAVTAYPHRHILVLNCGSSSLKFGLFETSLDRLETLASGEAASIGKPGSTFSARGVDGRHVCEATHFMDQKYVIGRVLALFETWRLPPPAAIGHRIVHGGLSFAGTA